MPPDGERIEMICEGSGCPAHIPLSASNLSAGMCSMCGHFVALIGQNAIIHTRDDILARIERGDFDAT